MKYGQRFHKPRRAYSRVEAIEAALAKEGTHINVSDLTPYQDADFSGYSFNDGKRTRIFITRTAPYRISRAFRLMGKFSIHRVYEFRLKA